MSQIKRNEKRNTLSALRRIHGLRTPNEGINQKNLKFWADVADIIFFGRT